MKGSHRTIDCQRAPKNFGNIARGQRDSYGHFSSSLVPEEWMSMLPQIRLIEERRVIWSFPERNLLSEDS